MKKQVTTLAAMLLASNVAVAGVSQMSADSIGSIVRASKVLAAGTVEFSQGGRKVSLETFNGALALGGASVASTAAAGKKAIGATVDAAQSTSNGLSNVTEKAWDTTVSAAKSTSTKASQSATSAKNAVVDSAQSTSAGISNAAEFTVDTVKSAASKSGRVIEVTASSLVDGTKWTLTFSYNSASSVGRTMIDSAQTLLQSGKTVVIATSNSGVVLVTDSANGVSAVLQGDIKGGSSTIIASGSNSARSFESNMVNGLQKK